MRLWQQFMIYLARNPSIKTFMHSRAALSDLARRFVGGSTPLKGVKKAQTLAGKGFKSSLFNLGEYVEDRSVIQQTVSDLKAAAGHLADSGLDVHISVDPTQIGLQIDPAFCRENAAELACAVKNNTGREGAGPQVVLMLDMEDATVAQATLDLYTGLVRQELPVGITLQAYLHRTRQDIASVIVRSGMVRLVKGAFAESSHIAYTRKEAINASYLDLAGMMLSEKARANGFYPVFATHDHKMIEKIIVTAQKNGWEKGSYEFELLYGVRTALQEQLVQSGETVRLYLPFGTDWWPYAIRRVGETPKNIRFLLNALFKS